MTHALAVAIACLTACLSPVPTASEAQQEREGPEHGEEPRDHL
jgi:hypothetical protein